MYRLKPQQEAFRVVAEGPFDGHTFEHGQTYDEVPAQEAHKFEEIPAAPAAPAPRRKKGGDDE